MVRIKKKDDQTSRRAFLKAQILLAQTPSYYSINKMCGCHGGVNEIETCLIFRKLISNFQTKEKYKLEKYSIFLLNIFFTNHLTYRGIYCVGKAPKIEWEFLVCECYFYP